MKLTETSSKEDMFAYFYARGRVFVKDMSNIELQEHVSVLSKIALEAKATLRGAVDESQERQSKNRSNKTWLTTNRTDINSDGSSDAINAVRVRTARMSKMDKMRADLLKTGIAQDIVDRMIREMESRTTESDLSKIKFAPAKPLVNSLTKLANELTDGEIKPTSNKKPFDASGLKFGIKKVN